MILLILAVRIGVICLLINRNCSPFQTGSSTHQRLICPFILGLQKKSFIVIDILASQAYAVTERRTYIILHHTAVFPKQTHLTNDIIITIIITKLKIHRLLIFHLKREKWVKQTIIYFAQLYG